MLKTHNLAKPSKKATIEIPNIKPIVPKWIKPQIINPHSYQHPYQTLTTFKTPI